MAKSTRDRARHMGARAAMSHWLPRRIGPRIGGARARRASDSADRHSLAIPLARPSPSAAHPALCHRPLIQKVLVRERQRVAIDERCIRARLRLPRPHAACRSARCGQLLQRRFDLFGKGGRDRGGCVARHGGMVLHAQDK